MLSLFNKPFFLILSEHYVKQKTQIKVITHYECKSKKNIDINVHNVHIVIFLKESSSSIFISTWHVIKMYV